MDILSTLHAYAFRALHEDILKTSYMNILISCAVNVFRMSMEILSWHHIKDLKDYMEHSHEFVKGFPLSSHYIARKNHKTFHGGRPQENPGARPQEVWRRYHQVADGEYLLESHIELYWEIPEALHVDVLRTSAETIFFPTVYYVGHDEKI